MLNKLEALKVFCTTAETMQFREAASRLAVSPPVVTRIIAELEDHLGEALFQRNTRQIRLTDFGDRFLPQAQQLLEESERLFAPSKRKHIDEMSGLVRITVPELPHESAILDELFAVLTPYPDLILDWRTDGVRLNVVESQIDIGLRIGNLSDSRLIARRLGEVSEKIVATPHLIEQYGIPKTINDLQKNFPLTAALDANTGRFWSWYINEETQFMPRNPVFISSNIHNSLQAALSGRGFSHQLDWLCDPHLQNGKLVEVLADIPKIRWPIYLYRPQRAVTPVRVKVVFDLLAAILSKYFN
ncbi:LysR family transcriptional regulator [Chelonobacter oris]|uniref:LysR family transcriptional regulator n=1 Tax=Chelonobacter oris TaxID=505317 RepID=A0A0A3BAX1_9PAST|nr:LysR family transcriptional regulator [Chelonobacter oris]KGQ70664.1 LysR family transcriptional regulator [Chelonobacter oris]MDH2999160.1 LysR family transcriptional regulator [Chelonobacter oris]